MLTSNGERPQMLSNVAAISRTEGPVNITHYNIARTYDVQANVEGTDLGSVSDAVRRSGPERLVSVPRTPSE